MENQTQLKVEYIAIDKLIPYDKNPRNNSPAVEQCAASIRDYGFGQPISVDENMVIISGHTRRLAALKIGMEKIPCIVRRDLTPEQVRAYRVVDNKIAELSEWNEELLAQEIAALPEFNFADYGFDPDDFMTDIGDADASEDAVPEVSEQEPVRSKRGEVYQCGEHRLMCGDSTSTEDFKKLMNGEKADLVFTDPPYGMKKESEGVLNDNLNFDDLLEFNKRWIQLTFANIKDNGSWYCWGIDEPLMDIYANILKPMQKRNEITFRNLITWDKGTGQGQTNEDFRMYPIADEKCLFVMVGVQGYNINSDHYFEGWEPIRSYLAEEAEKVGITSNKQLKEVCGVEMYSHWFTKSQWAFITEEHYQELQKYAEGRAFKREYDSLKREFYATRAYFDNTHDNMNNVWHFPRANVKEREAAGGHATPKPIALCARGIKTSSREGESVLDVFGGSGSTLIACEQNGRKCYMMELDPHYCDVIRKRWAEFVHGEGCDWEALTPMVEPAPAATEAKA